MSRSTFDSSSTTTPSSATVSLSPTTAGQGRRLACCIPVRGGEGTGRPVEFLLVSSRRCARGSRVDGRRDDVREEGERNLVFPKGGWEADETLFEAAEREAFEEAGVSGRLETPFVDQFSYESLKDRPDKGHTRARTVYVFVLNVTEEHADWPEKDSRTRAWLRAGEVRRRLKHDYMRQVFDSLCADRGWL